MAESTNSASAENHVLISEDFRSMEVPYGENVLGCVGDINVIRVFGATDKTFTSNRNAVIR